MNGALELKDCINDVCPNSGKPVTAEGLMMYQGEVVGFCNSGCRDAFENAVKIFEASLGN